MKAEVRPLPRQIAKHVMTMATMVLATMAGTTNGFLQDDRDGLWEMGCGPHSWLTEACEAQGLQPRRIGLSTGHDFYKHETWSELRRLYGKHRPRRLWFSLPCTKWCQWSSLNYATDERKDLLASYRRRELRMIWMAVRFIEFVVDQDPQIEVYWEWPWPCFGWKQPPLQHLQTFLQQRGHEWLDCRLDGCNYGMREDTPGGLFLRKQWLVRTTSVSFHQDFRSKVCPGGHSHAHVQGLETIKSAYYPRRMVESIARHWRRRTVSDRNLRLVFLKEDQPSHLDFEWDDVRRPRWRHYLQNLKMGILLSLLYFLEGLMTSLEHHRVLTWSGGKLVWLTSTKLQGIPAIATWLASSVIRASQRGRCKWRFGTTVGRALPCDQEALPRVRYLRRPRMDHPQRGHASAWTLRNGQCQVSSSRRGSCSWSTWLQS